MDLLLLVCCCFKYSPKSFKSQKVTFSNVEGAPVEIFSNNIFKELKIFLKSSFQDNNVRGQGYNSDLRKDKHHPDWKMLLLDKC